MDENSEKLPLIPESEPTIPEKESTIPEKEQEPPPQPKARGRPKGAKDAKPRIKRVPIQQEEEEPPPRVKAKKVEVRQEEKPPPEPEEPPEEESEEELPPPKSPRTLHRERVQHAAAERRQQARDRQDHFERILDNFMGF